MIANIRNGKDTAGLIRYLFETKKAKGHSDPHLVASWDGFAPDPGRADDLATARKLLVADLDLHVKQAKRLGRAPEQHVWHCSIRAAPEDRILTDDDWADIARRIVAATGIAPQDDPDGCRWVAIRHADDHIHIAATKVRADLRPARHWNDYLRADKQLIAIEKEYGLRRIPRGDRTAAKRPTRAEQEKAQRSGHHLTPRERLRTTVRTAVAAATTPEEFFRILTGAGILLDIQRLPSGGIRGYTVALTGDTNAAGEPIWYAGSTLAPDLSYPKISKRLAATTDPVPAGHRRPNPWHMATAAAQRIPTILDGDNDEASQAHITALGEALDLLPRLTTKDLQAQLQQAAIAFERATRSRIQSDDQHAGALRYAIRAMLREPTPNDGGTLLAMFLDVAVLALIAAERWHDRHHHDQQVAAARQALHYAQAAYHQAAAAPLAALAQHTPPPHAVEQHAHHLRQAAPAHADQILTDPAWNALTAALTAAETAGHDPARLLQQAVDQRTLDDANSPARTLTWRILRLTQRPAPSPRALAAQARSVTATQVMRTAPAENVPSRPSSPAGAPGRRR